MSAPSGRSWSRDSNFIYRHPAYADPYYGAYYGSYNSPFYYLWLGSMMDGDNSNNPLPPESDSRVADSLSSYLGLIKAEAELVEDK